MQNKRSRLGQVFWTRVDRFPPILMRLLAIDEHRKPISTLALSQASGLSPAMIEAISQSTEWDQIPLQTFRKFSSSCRIDLMDRTQSKRANSYLNGKRVGGLRQAPSFQYLRIHPEWETYYRPLMERYLESLRSRTSIAAG